MKTIFKTVVIILFGITSFSCSNNDEILTPNNTINNTNSLNKLSDSNVSTLAGSIAGYNDDNGFSAQFNAPFGVAVDRYGYVYVADWFNDKIRLITPNGDVKTLAGSEQGFTDGKRKYAKFNRPRGVAVDREGYVYVADTQNHKIRTISPEGVVKTLAGSTSGYADGYGSNAKFNRPMSVAVDADRNVYVADESNFKIRKITPNGLVTTLAGSSPGYADGQGVNAMFLYPRSVTVDRYGIVYVAEYSGHRIRMISQSGTVKTLAGTTAGYKDGKGDYAQFLYPSGISVDYHGNVYVADSNNHKIRKISPNGIVSTLAGTTAGFLDGLTMNAKFIRPADLAVGENGTVFIVDSGNHKVRKLIQ